MSSLTLPLRRTAACPPWKSAMSMSPASQGPSIRCRSFFYIKNKQSACSVQNAAMSQPAPRELRCLQWLSAMHSIGSVQHSSQGASYAPQHQVRERVCLHCSCKQCTKRELHHQHVWPITNIFGSSPTYLLTHATRQSKLLCICVAATCHQGGCQVQRLEIRDLTYTYAAQQQEPVSVHNLA